MSQSALNFALAFLNLLPELVQMTTEVEALWQNTTAALNNMIAQNRDPTDAEWQALNDQINTLRAKLNA